jgi:hypothetical protein
MNGSEPGRLTLQEAAVLARCTTKTLYRYMDRGQLAFHRGPDNRRYVEASAVRALFPVTPPSGAARTVGELAALLHEIKGAVDRQSALLEQAIALYQPKTLAALRAKHAGHTASPEAD